MILRHRTGHRNEDRDRKLHGMEVHPYHEYLVRSKSHSGSAFGPPLFTPCAGNPVNRTTSAAIASLFWLQ